MYQPHGWLALLGSRKLSRVGLVHPWIGDQTVRVELVGQIRGAHPSGLCDIPNAPGILSCGSAQCSMSHLSYEPFNRRPDSL